MAQYIKFRLNAAKVSVTMAFVALLGGVAAKTGLARSGSAHTSATNTFKWLPTLSTKGLSLTLKEDIKLIEGALVKLYHKDLVALQTIQREIKGDFVAFNQKITRLDKDLVGFISSGTAANANKLGGMPASAFLQGQGGVATGALSSLNGNSARKTLLTVPGTNGEIIVVCQPAPSGGSIQVLVHNGTSLTLTGIVAPDQTTADRSIPLPANSDTLLGTFDMAKGTGGLRLQTFPTTGFNNVMTLTVSFEGTGNGLSVVGQLVNGVNGDG